MGRLVSLDEALPLDVPLYWQVARIMAPALAPLTAAIRAAAREALVQEAR
jgi:LysR family transcriptional regulator (chromosome initiation inhibitor)